MVCERLALLIYAGTLAFSLPHQAKTTGSPQTTPAADSSISVQLTPEREVWKVGQAIGIEVKVVNQGKRPVFVGLDLNAPGNWMYHLDLWVQDSLGHPAEGFSTAADSLPGSKESFVSFLARNWIVLEPGYFYGTVVGIDASLFPLLGKPGRYKVCGVLKSLGLTPTMYFNVLANHPEEVKQLPYNAWEGEVKTNCVEVSIVPRSKQGKDHR